MFVLRRASNKKWFSKVSMKRYYNLIALNNEISIREHK